MKKIVTLMAVVLVTACQQNIKRDIDMNKELLLRNDTTFNYQRDASKAQDVNSTYTAGTNVTSRPAQTKRSYPRRNVNSGTTVNRSASTTSTQNQNVKKGWSNAAKGAVIGAVGGAVIGAVVSKKKGKGAIIGGVIGAGGGYAIGRAKDKKTGRANLVNE